MLRHTALQFWTKMAIFFCYIHWNSGELHYYNKTRGKRLVEEANTLLGNLIEQKDIEPLWADFVSEQEDLTSDRFEYYDRIPVINDRLKDSIKSKKGPKRRDLLCKELLSNECVTKKILKTR